MCERASVQFRVRQCVHACLSVCLFVSVRLFVCLSISVRLCIYVCVCVFVGVIVWIYDCVYMYKMYVFMYVFVLLLVYVCVCMCVCVCMFVCVCVYVCVSQLNVIFKNILLIARRWLFVVLRQDGACLRCYSVDYTDVQRCRDKTTCTTIHEYVLYSYIQQTSPQCITYMPKRNSLNLSFLSPKLISNNLGITRLAGSGRGERTWYQCLSPLGIVMPIL